MSKTSQQKSEIVMAAIEGTSFDTLTRAYAFISKYSEQVCNKKWGSDSIRKFVERNNLKEELLKRMDKTSVPLVKDNEVKQDFKDDSGIITVRSLNILTLEDALRISKVDTEVWEVERVITNSWETTMGKNKTHTGLPETYTNYQVKVWLKPKTVDNIHDLKSELIEEMKVMSPKVPAIHTLPNLDNEHLFVFSLNDLHIGRLAWHEEVEKDYDHKVAVHNVNESLNGILSYVSSIPKSKILFLVGNDLFNYDYSYPTPTTSRGTPMTSDSRWQKIFRIGRKLTVEVINRLSALAPVHTLVIPGNHDYQTVFYLGEVLEVIYANNENVFIDNRPKMRKYFEWGNNLIGASHGEKERPAEFHAIMSAEQKEAWGRTSYRYFYLGHQHHEYTQTRKVGETFKGLKMPVYANEDYKGVIIEWLPNLAYRDHYEYDQGYVGTIRSAKAAIHHITKGRVVTYNHNL